MGKGLGPIQTQTLEYLTGLEGWSARAGEVAIHIYGLDWRPPFRSAKYQTVARALRTLANRGLISETTAGLYRVHHLEH